MKERVFSLVLLILMSALAQSQQYDTIKIDAAKLRIKQLNTGRHEWLVYTKAGKDSSRKRFMIWRRDAAWVDYNSKKAIKIVQEWESNDTIVHKAQSICNADSFSPLWQKKWTQGQGETEFDFEKNKAVINGIELSGTDTARAKKRVYDAFQKALTDQNVLNWHLDLEAFQLLPYKQNAVFAINFYDPGFSAPRLQYYTVTGTDQLITSGKQPVDCWLLSHKVSETRYETFWVNKKTFEVMKLEQITDNTYRYKIKLAFTDKSKDI